MYINVFNSKIIFNLKKANVKSKKYKNIKCNKMKNYKFNRKQLKIYSKLLFIIFISFLLYLILIIEYYYKFQRHPYAYF